MTLAGGFVILAGIVLLAEGLSIYFKPSRLLPDFEGSLPPQSLASLRALAAGAPIASGLFLLGGFAGGVSPPVLLAYVALVLGVVGIVRAIAALCRPHMGKQYVAVAVEIAAAGVALVLACLG